jgi:hypothetical protein
VPAAAVEGVCSTPRGLGLAEVVGVDALTVRSLTDAELIAARRGGLLEPYAAQRSGLPPRRGRGVGSTNRMSSISWRRTPSGHAPPMVDAIVSRTKPRGLARHRHRNYARVSAQPSLRLPPVLFGIVRLTVPPSGRRPVG